MNMSSENNYSLIPFIDLASQQERIQSSIQKRMNEVLKHGKYIMGPEVQELEEKLSLTWGPLQNAQYLRLVQPCGYLGLWSLWGSPGRTKRYCFSVEKLD
jgi:hypothetical protein